MQDLNDLYLFVQAVDHGGFAAAARALGLQKSKVSRRIGLLEDRLGVRLIQRSTRRFSVTEIGQEYYRRCVAMLVEAEGAQTVIDQSRAEPCGVVRLSCPTGLLAFQFGELLGRFMALYPAVELHVESTNRRVDVIGEGFDLAIRVRPPPLAESELVMRRFDERTIRIVASPDLLKQRAITLPADLAGLPSLDFGPAGGEHRWRLTHADGSVAEVRHSPRLVTDDMAVLRDAALAGAGAARLPTLVVWDDLQAGRLVTVLPDWRPSNEIVHAVFPSRRGLLPSVRALLDFLADECAAQRRRVPESGHD
ncbi:LysR family transcriptional regulator [Sphingopyxis sp. H038]|uniref:LysR substrate-binding domain-containing protein n=2 Tax=Alphaproteobacteria TaxID=28211 RepID=UPI000731E2D8|nr:MULTISPECIES: LysR substrate-binding domain-containing protein [unclassified Sphingopyxis]KTE04235.1 LysR family transcriptional regulator [Sphingopyxis sp. H012]KTE13562.1 LysR family transcriptional regulator [Sphingopyxis sp. H053]KTE15752.1 LysR family transcriptional regulator [Sphingopyxis sp. H093]KTE15777.1 LysR family transcriptional regulator [Sphingopyxis sp. H093]KTE30243.1 LysR family transcriptional regulator [Sphingopyxis sp. H080]